MNPDIDTDLRLNGSSDGDNDEHQRTHNERFDHSSSISRNPSRLASGFVSFPYLIEPRGDSVGVVRQRARWCVDVVEAGAVVPQDLAANLVAERQSEELLHRLGKRAVGMRI